MNEKMKKVRMEPPGGLSRVIVKVSSASGSAVCSSWSILLVSRLVWRSLRLGLLSDSSLPRLEDGEASRVDAAAAAPGHSARLDIAALDSESDPEDDEVK